MTVGIDRWTRYYINMDEWSRESRNQTKAKITIQVYNKERKDSAALCISNQHHHHKQRNISINDKWKCSREMLNGILIWKPRSTKILRNIFQKAYHIRVNHFHWIHRHFNEDDKKNKSIHHSVAVWRCQLVRVTCCPPTPPSPIQSARICVFYTTSFSSLMWIVYTARRRCICVMCIHE